MNSNGDLFAATYAGDPSNGGVFKLPNGSNQWVRINSGLGNGWYYFESIGYAPNGTLFLSGSDGSANKLYKSVNNGANWTPVTVTSNHYFSNFSFAANGQCYAASKGSGVFYSGDGGKHWTILNSGLGHLNVWSIAYGTGVGLFAGTYDGGVYRCGGAGNGWAGAGLNGKQIFCFESRLTNQVFAGAADGIYRSLNNGTTWTAVNQGLTSFYVQAIVKSSSNDLFAGTEDGIFYSSDSGDNWVERSTGLTNTEILSMTFGSSNRLFAGTPGGLFKSDNSGVTWTAVTDPDVLGVEIKALEKTSDGILYAGNTVFYSCLFKSTDNGETWNPVSNVPTFGIISLESNAHNDVFAGEYIFGRVYITENGGADWIDRSPYFYDNGTTDLLNTTSQYLFAAQYVYGGADSLFISGDEGLTWTTYNQGLPVTDFLALGEDPVGNLFVGTGGEGTPTCGVYKLTMRFDAWVQTGLPYAVICCQTPGDANDDGAVNAGDAVFIVNYIFKGGPQPPCFAQADANNDGNINNGDAVYIINYIFRGGPPPVCGSAANKGNPDLIRTELIPPQAQLIVSGTDSTTIIEIFARDELAAVSIDLSGVDNAEIDNSVEDMPMIVGHDDKVSKIGFFDLTGQKTLPAGKYRIAEIHGRAVVVSALGIGLNSAVVQMPVNKGGDDLALPRDFALAQNRPNPFNPATNITFSLPKGCDVMLEVFNIVGQKVATPVNKRMEAGYHSIQWDGRGSDGAVVASGIYFYRLKAGDFVDTRKMMLLK